MINLGVPVIGLHSNLCVGFQVETELEGRSVFRGILSTKVDLRDRYFLVFGLENRECVNGVSTLVDEFGIFLSLLLLQFE